PTLTSSVDTLSAQLHRFISPDTDPQAPPSFPTRRSSDLHIIRVCMGTACYIKGAQSLIDRIGTDLGIKPGETTKDGKFTLEATRCLGACGLAPVMTIDDDVHGRLMQGDIPKVLKKYSEPAKEDERA